MNEKQDDPRFLQRKSKKLGFYESILQKFKHKIRFKKFRMDLVNQNINNQQKIEFKAMEMLFPLFIINSIVGSFILSKGASNFQRFFLIIGTTSYTYLCLIFYGEKVLFEIAAKQNDSIGFYLRHKYMTQFPECEISQYYAQLNQKYFPNSNINEFFIKDK